MAKGAVRVPIRVPRSCGSQRACVLVDPQDAYQVLARHWKLDGPGYARWKTVRKVDGRLRHLSFLLHRELLGLQRGDRRQVDHINGDRLDNRRCNLRVLSKPEQQQNVRGRQGYRGVQKHHTGKWRARYAGKHIGLYATEEEALDAVITWRREHAPLSNAERDQEYIGA